MERDWAQARAKVERERVCRVCGETEHGPRGPIEAAHVIGRAHDVAVLNRDDLVRVDQRDVVPLCRGCHGDYDGHKLDLLPYLTHMEQAQAVGHVGIMGALRRICGSVRAVSW